MTAPLEQIGHIEVPDSVLHHRFVMEALAGATVLAESVEMRESLNQVVGTANTRQVELYGWAPNVDSHVDNTGIVYLCTLNDGRSTVNIMPAGEPTSIWLPRGTVVRLDDRVEHWTEDDACRVAAFIGSFEQPDDAAALVHLQSAVTALARRDYYGAPRVREGFRALREDECLVAEGDSVRTMLLADAERQRLWHERCALCDAPAVKLDRLFPYASDMHRCAQHRRDA